MVPQRRRSLVYHRHARTPRLVLELVTNPEFTFQLKQSVQADLPARATPIVAKDKRRDIMNRIHQKLGGNRDLDAWVEGSPLVEVELLPE